MLMIATSIYIHCLLYREPHSLLAFRSQLLYCYKMSEIYEKTVINLQRDPQHNPQEKFKVSSRTEQGITFDDVKEVVGILATDLALLQPPLPVPYTDKILIKTGRDWTTDREHTVTAYFIRDDATTVNAAQIGYFRIGFPGVNPVAAE